jgi:hypothetical protein
MDRQENNLSEEQVPKTPATIKSVFRWLFVVVLAFLLIAAVIFQAPWKVIALLVVFLLACTALPRPFRKWFWLSVGVVVIALIVWVFLPEDNEGWQPYTFDEELAALEAKYAVPPEENAAMIYNELLADDAKYKEPPKDKFIAELMEKGQGTMTAEDVNDWLACERYSTFYPDFWNYEIDDLTRNEPWKSQDHPQVIKWLNERRYIIEKLLQASRIKKCHFPIPSSAMRLEHTMKRLATMRRWTHLLIRAANNDIGDGRTEEAIEKQLAVLQMAKHLYQQAIMIDLLVGLACESMSLKNINLFIVEHNPSERQLAAFEYMLTSIKHDWDTDWVKYLDAEKLSGKISICSILYEVNPTGNIRFSRNPTAIFPNNKRRIKQRAYWQKRPAKARAILFWFLIPSDPQKVSKFVDDAYERLYQMAETDFGWNDCAKEYDDYDSEPFSMSAPLNLGDLFKLYADMEEPVIYRLHYQYIRTVSERKGTRLLIALKRYKNEFSNWPESLEALKPTTHEELFTDPLNNDSYIYKAQNDSFVLYSKGLNNIDDNNVFSGYANWTGADDWPIWPSQYYRTKKERANAE